MKNTEKEYKYNRLHNKVKYDVHVVIYILVGYHGYLARTLLWGCNTIILILVLLVTIVKCG